MYFDLEKLEHNMESAKSVYKELLSEIDHRKSQKLWEIYSSLYEIDEIIAIQKIDDRKRSALDVTPIDNLHSVVSRY